ncbi:TrkA C-terminal domain-containing protein [Metaclostridioides mangenotii]|jgi:K+/H+ antiporter YhaU regulatory subunit KhtT|uniref:K+/H+ antiporter YhaU regulatory subunit KhtT n=1 Tax=Metaclostridioides mangenotii TaxID=1540 RepID=A0ABS4E8Z1_9FIRM|nr:TrkA C-terminal domain-containing protein [Clostridioides mangenotii]MBP1854416.1 K+/H+ antiporter YhaU regulatory subunit KhtT [Clostridioides mangenotii]
MDNNYTMPIYQKIALDVANKIYTGEIKEDTILYGRSILAGKYNVSPETIRRAVKILEDIDVVKSVKGKGVIVLSSEKAYSFIKKYQDITNISSYKSTLRDLIDSKADIDVKIIDTIGKIIDYSNRLEIINPLVPIQFEIKSDCKYIGDTAANTNFWQNTGATIVAIKRGEELIISPGPYIEFLEGDIVLAVGDQHIYNSVPMFLYDKK